MLRFAALLLAVLPAVAQTTGTASIAGTVSDPSGANIPGAKITVRNQQTEFIYEGVTGASGDYYIPNLSSGTYQLTFEAQGFKTSVQRDIVLRINETPRIEVKLEAGSLTETVNVTSRPPLLETENAGVGQVLESNTVERLPVMQKFVHRVLLYMPNMGTVNGNHAVGQRQRSIGYSMDGVSGKEPAVGQVNDYQRSMVASLDSIQEFKMWTNGTPAEFGHASGGLLSVVFKSGTNEFHGTVEDRYTGGKLRHRHYLEQSRITSPFDYHEWGATASGPVIRNRTFWFFGFQQHYEKLAETIITTVPNQDMYNGDFSFGGKGLPIYDPGTTRKDAAGNWTRDPLPLTRSSRATLWSVTGARKGRCAGYRNHSRSEASTSNPSICTTWWCLIPTLLIPPPSMRPAWGSTAARSLRFRPPLARAGPPSWVSRESAPRRSRTFRTPADRASTDLARAANRKPALRI
jgi:hypothetical protein